MRKWGILISAFYALVVVFLLIPLSGFLSEYDLGDPLLDAWPPVELDLVTQFWPVTVWVVLLLVGQALLLFLSVDTSFRRIRPRRHIGVSIATVALMIGLLSGIALWSLIAVIGGDDVAEDAWVNGFWPAVALFWVCWGIVFNRFKAGSSEKLDRLVSWLVKGSVLELLIVVPCHVFVRHRGDCSAPLVTGFGISTGIAVMLLAFGPSVLYLYQKRLASYKSHAERNATGDEPGAPKN